MKIQSFDLLKIYLIMRMWFDFFLICSCIIIILLFIFSLTSMCFPSAS